MLHNIYYDSYAGETREDLGYKTPKGVFQLAEGYISDDYMDVLADGVWQNFFTEQPAPLTREQKAEYLSQVKGVSLGSDAFFPFGDNIERAHRSGVEYIIQPGGSIRDDNVIETCDKYGITMAFNGVRLFHH